MSTPINITEYEYTYIATSRDRLNEYTCIGPHGHNSCYVQRDRSVMLGAVSHACLSYIHIHTLYTFKHHYLTVHPSHFQFHPENLTFQSATSYLSHDSLSSWVMLWTDSVTDVQQCPHSVHQNHAYIPISSPTHISHVWIYTRTVRNSVSSCS